MKNRIKRSIKRLEHFTADVIYDRADGLKAKLYGSFLWCLSQIFRVLISLRHFCYDNRILRDSPLGCQVVVVGNLTVGGTGKTPIVEKFARALAERGRKVAILSRGYKSKSDGAFKRFIRWITHGEAPKPKVVSDGKNVLLDSEVAGDEPFMLASNLPGVVVIVDKNRVRAGHYAITHFGADVLLLDDGFQYLPLRGQAQLLLVDKTNPFGNLSMLPRGILREPISHLRRASFIFLTKSDGAPDAELEALIRKYNPSVELIECAHRPSCLVDFSTRERVGLETLKGKSVACFCAIAAPESFERLLRECGAKIVFRERFMDHHRFDEDELEEVFKTAVQRGAEMVLTTEKDAVRIRSDFRGKLPFYYTRLEIEILSGAEDFNAAVEKVCFPKRKADEDAEAQPGAAQDTSS